MRNFLNIFSGVLSKNALIENLRFLQQEFSYNDADSCFILPSYEHLSPVISVRYIAYAYVSE